MSGTGVSWKKVGGGVTSERRKSMSIVNESERGEEEGDWKVYERSYEVIESNKVKEAQRERGKSRT